MGLWKCTCHVAAWDLDSGPGLHLSVSRIGAGPGCRDREVWFPSPACPQAPLLSFWVRLAAAQSGEGSVKHRVCCGDEREGDELCAAGERVSPGDAEKPVNKGQG